MSSRATINNLSSLNEILVGPEYDSTSPVRRYGALWIHSNDMRPRQPHRHAELEFNLVTQGRAVYLVGERRYEMRANMLLWLFPAQDHVLIEESHDHRMWIGVFHPDFVDESCTTSATHTLREKDPPGDFCRRLAEDEARWLTMLFERVRIARENAPQFNSGLRFALLSAWAAYGATDDTSIGTDIHAAVEKAARIIRDETEDVGLDQIALRAGLSVPRLSLLFKQQTGWTITEFRNKQRIARFMALYGHGRRLTLLQAALEAGFGSYPQFHRVFKEAIGCSPADYRRKVTTGNAESEDSDGTKR